MAKQVDREYAYVCDNDVVPGYLYNKTLFKYFARTDGKKIETVNTPPTFLIDVWNFKKIDSISNRTHTAISTWQKDFLQEYSENVILVRGTKTLEKKGIDPPLDRCWHTVTSILYKSCQDMLMYFSQKPTEGSLKALEAYLNSVLAEEKESFIPQELLSQFIKAYIYQSYSSPRTDVNNFKHGCEQFCLTLKNAKISTIPVQAVIESPKPDQSDAVKDGVSIGTQSTVTVSPDSGIPNCLDGKSSMHSEIAETHFPNNCADTNLILNSNVQSQKANIVLCTTKVTDMANECRKVQESRSKYDFVASRDNGYTNGTEKLCRSDPKNCFVGQPREYSGIGRGFGTRMGRGKSSAADLFSVGRRTQESCIENNINSNSSRTNRPGSQGTSDSIRRSALQSAQNNQSHKVQNPAHVSRVQELKKKYEENDDHAMTDQNKEQLQLSNDAEKLDKPHGGFQSPVSPCNSTLPGDAQPGGHVTTVSITFSSQETKLQVQQISKSQAEMVSCSKGLVANNKNGSETSNSEKLEELQKTDCKTRDQSLHEDKFDEIDKLVEQNWREISVAECSSTKGTAFSKEDQIVAYQTKANKSKQLVPTSTEDTDHKKFTEVDSHSAKVNKTEKVVGQESPIKNNDQSDCALSNGTMKRSSTNSKTLLRNENESKSKIEKSNAKKAKVSGQSNLSYSSVVTQKDDSVTGSRNINTKQNKLFQGLINDDEMVDLKSTKNVCHTKEKQKSEKDRKMKTKLLNPVKFTKDPCGLERKYFGIVNESVPEKVLILLGASGSGKTTLLNFIANYFHGNKNADDELIHVEYTSQTSAITAYTFCSSHEDIPITIIDTPGLNDSSGGEVRDHVQSLKTFLANAASKNVDVHALGFVAQAHLVRLTSSERLVMDYVSTMFGQNVSEHLITLVTFADNQDTPPVIEAMKNYKVNFKQFLKFNNSALSNGKTDEVDDLDRVYYRVCWRNWKKCLKTLKDLPPLSVNVMKAVQSEVYNTTVTESAEKDLKAEIISFFCSYLKEKSLSRRNLQVCEQIWSLAAVVQRLKGAQMSSSRTIEDILIENAKETCKDLRISPESIVYTLALAPSKALTIVGTEIIQSMSHAYAIMKASESKSSSNHLIDISHCHGCNKKKEHKMKRTEFNWVIRKTAAVGSEIICFKCEDCKCAGDLHGDQPPQPAHQSNKILHLTMSRLRKALQSSSFSGFAVSEDIFLKHLREQLPIENQEFIDTVLLKE